MRGHKEERKMGRMGEISNYKFHYECSIESLLFAMLANILEGLKDVDINQ